MKFFNTAGPVNQPDHYKLDPLSRWDLDEILFLIQQKKYFILHAPRQTGKTSCLLALQDLLNVSGDYNCIYLNVEIGQAARNNIDSAMKAIISELCDRAESTLKVELPFNSTTALAKSGSGKALNSAITALSVFCSLPVVLLIDEIDSLVGDTLISVLRQLRGGYDKRPDSFPVSLVLCGVRDIKDYRIVRGNQDIITGGSCFNIKAESLRLGNFQRHEVHKLLLEHSLETGQKFEDGVADYIFEETDGQPWLVNAIAFEVTFKMKENRDRKVLITLDKVKEAINRIIVSRAVHLDQLADKLKEDRVRRVILPMILNKDINTSSDDDREYCIDLGLVKNSSRGLVIANKIYREIIPRELTKTRQDDFKVVFDPDWINSDGSLNTNLLFEMFADFWCTNSEIWSENMAGYKEAAPHLVFQAFLQRVANGSGFVRREYALGRGRTDLYLEWFADIDGSRKMQRVVIELKIMRKNDSLKTVRANVLEQTAKYAKRCIASSMRFSSAMNITTENHIIIFDRDHKREWQTKLYSETAELDGMTFTIWGM